MDTKILSELDILQLYLPLKAGDAYPLTLFLRDLPKGAAALEVFAHRNSQALKKLVCLLLEDGEHHEYALVLLERLPAEMLVDAEDQTPLFVHLAAALEDEKLRQVYCRLCEDLDPYDYGWETILCPMQAAYTHKKYGLLQDVFANALLQEQGFEVSEWDDLHPVCYAAQEKELPLAQAYVGAMHQAGLGLFRERAKSLPRDWFTRHSTQTVDEEYAQTVLDFVAASGNCQVMELLLDAGADPNARNRMGYTLLDQAIAPRMQQLLTQWGGRAATEQELALYAAIRAAGTESMIIPWSPKQPEAYPKALLEKVLSFQPPLFRFVNCYGHGDPRDRDHMDLLQALANGEHIKELSYLFKAVKDQLDEQDNYRLLSHILGEGPFGEYMAYELAERKSILAMLRGLYRAGLRTRYEKDGQTIAQNTMGQLVDQYRRDLPMEEALLAAYCKVLCRFTGESSYEVFLNAWLRSEKYRYNDNIPMPNLDLFR